jgi:soluble lytic murein transglycosylase
VPPRSCFALFIFLALCQSCAGRTVLDLPAPQVLENLKKGDTDFIINADVLRLDELARIKDSLPFYAALLVEKSGEAERAETLLNLSLKSPVTRIASAKRLIPGAPNRFFEDFLKDSSIAEGTGWEKVYKLAKETEKNKKIDEKSIFLDDTLPYFYAEKPDSAYRWLFERLKPAFSEDLAPVISIIEGRIAVDRAAYREALAFFRKSGQLDGKDLPGTDFLRSIELLGDLGRAFQYTAPAEGIALFTKWSENLKGEEASGAARYRLLYFAGRMARSAKKPKEAIAFFEEALPLAPDGEQKDACIWYILDSAYGEKPENSLPFIEKYARIWENADYFNDILDKIVSWLIKSKRWAALESIYDDVIRYGSADTASQYAYLSGRALELGFLRSSYSNQNSRDYYKIAYQRLETSRITLPALYYRLLAAKRLGLDAGLDALPVKNNTGRDGSASRDELDFLDGFFQYGCAEFAYPYIREHFDKLSFTELRSYAEQLNGAGQWQTLINLMIRCRESAGFQCEKRDLELSFPRGYQGPVENYAAEAGLKPSLLFALVRQESLFTAGARSRTGASGLTQLMDATAREVADTLAAQGGPDYRDADGAVDLLNPEINLHLGALYYKQLLDRMQNAENALLAYNGGVTRVRRWRAAENNLPDDLFLESIEFRETREYGRTVIAGEAMYAYLYY